MVKYTLHYFDGRARGETIRMTFAAAGVPFEDIRVDFEKGWPAFKSKTPTGMLPVLEVDGQMIPESMAIARFVARETGLAAKTSLEQARLEAVVDVITEVREASLPLFFAKDKDKKAQLSAALQEKVDKYYSLVEKKASHNKGGKGFIVGDSVTLADIHFYVSTELVLMSLPDALKPFPTLQALYKRVAELPRVATYLKNRKQTPF